MEMTAWFLTTSSSPPPRPPNQKWSNCFVFHIAPPPPPCPPNQTARLTSNHDQLHILLLLHLAHLTLAPGKADPLHHQPEGEVHFKCENISICVVRPTVRQTTRCLTRNETWNIFSTLKVNNLEVKVNHFEWKYEELWFLTVFPKDSGSMTNSK